MADSLANYISYVFSPNKPDPDGLLLASLYAFPFEGILEQEDQIIAYLSKRDHSAQLTDRIDQICKMHDAAWRIEEIEDKNWNKEWESNFREIQVGKFCQIRASFHPLNKEFNYSLVINPKMAFGTGHHETTYMMIQAMETLDVREKLVFDFGCGTGILSILAKKMGAGDTVANDISEDAIENSKENELLNKVEGIHWIEGGIDKVHETKFDLVLANINRNVLVHDMNEIRKRLKTGAILLLSGILKQDLKLIGTTLETNDLKILNVYERGEWLCMNCLAS